MTRTSWSVLTDRETVTGETVALAGAACAGVGLLLTWVTINSTTHSGLNTDHGLIALACVGAIAAMTYYRPWGPRSIVVVLLSGITIFWLPLNYADSMFAEDLQVGILGQLFLAFGIELGTFDPIPGLEYGTGFQLTVLGGIGLAAVGLIELRRHEVTESWKKEVLGSFALVVFTFFMLESGAGLLLILSFTLGWFGLLATVYCDLQYVRKNSDWNPRSRLWLVGLAFPLLNLIIGAYYTYKRYRIGDISPQPGTNRA